MNKIAIVVSDTYPEITGKMLDKAKELLKEHTTSIVHVPGSFDVPFGVKQVIEKVDGVVTLGAIIQGDTSHDEVIGHSIAAALTQLSLAYNKPVTLGVSGPRITRQQAVDRIEKMSVKAVEACLKLLDKNVRNFPLVLD